MGYYSDFSVELDGEDFVDAFLMALKEVEEYNFSTALYSDGYGTLRASDCKWYDWYQEISQVVEALKLNVTVSQYGEDGEGNKVEWVNGEENAKYTRGWVRS